MEKITRSHLQRYTEKSGKPSEGVETIGLFEEIGA